MPQVVGRASLRGREFSAIIVAWLRDSDAGSIWVDQTAMGDLSCRNSMECSKCDRRKTAAGIMSNWSVGCSGNSEVLGSRIVVSCRQKQESITDMHGNVLGLLGKRTALRSVTSSWTLHVFGAMRPLPKSKLLAAQRGKVEMLSADA